MAGGVLDRFHRRGAVRAELLKLKCGSVRKVTAMPADADLGFARIEVALDLPLFEPEESEVGFTNCTARLMVASEQLGSAKLHLIEFDNCVNPVDWSECQGDRHLAELGNAVFLLHDDRSWDVQHHVRAVLPPEEPDWAVLVSQVDVDHGLAERYPGLAPAVLDAALVGVRRPGVVFAALLADEPEHFAGIGFTRCPDGDPRLSVKNIPS